MPEHAEEHPRSPAASPTLRVLEAANRFWIIGVGSLYVAGVLIVNIDLARYGLFTMALARPEYILVGAGWAALTFFTVSLMVLDFRILRERRAKRAEQAESPSVTDAREPKNSWWKRLLVAWNVLSVAWYALMAFFFAPVFAIGVVAVLHMFLGGSEGRWSGSYWSFLGMVLTLDVNALMVLFAYSVITGHHQWLAAEVRRGEDRGYLGCQTIFGGLVALTLYTWSVFPMIPQTFGGGERPLKYVLPAEAARLDWRALGLSKRDGTELVGPVVLLLETDTTYYLQRPGDEAGALTVDKRAVSALVPAERGRTRTDHPAPRK